MKNTSLPSAGWQVRKREPKDENDNDQYRYNDVNACWPYNKEENFFGKDGQHFGGFSFLSNDCETMSGLTLLFKSSKTRLDRVSTQQRFEAADHEALDDRVLCSYGEHADISASSSDLPQDTGQFVGAYDFNDTREDTPHMTLMHNESGAFVDLVLIKIFVKQRRDHIVAAQSLRSTVFCADSWLKVPASIP